MCMHEHCDVLVIGSGAAGLKAAITAADAGKDVLLATSALYGGSTFYRNSPEWGILYARDDADVERFTGEVLRAANSCVQPALVRMMAEQSRACFAELVSYGLAFTPLEDFGLVSCFAQRPRGAVLADLDQGMAALSRQLAARGNIRIRTDVELASLVVLEGRCQGAIGFAGQEGLLHIAAGATVLASGGGEALYRHGYAASPLVGSAYAMAARKGARVVNLEFVQFIQATLAPVRGLNYYQFLLDTLPRVTDTQGAPLLPGRLPPHLSEAACLRLRSTHGPFSCEDDAKYFDLAVADAGGAIITPDPGKVADTRYGHWRAFLEKVGRGTSEPMTIYPHCHAFNGGILINESAATDIPGLFAAGEAAGGCHGANRMGGNSMLGTQVFGRAAGRSAAAWCTEGAQPLTSAQCRTLLAEDLGEGGGEGDAAALFSRLQQTMQEAGFLRRSEDGLRGGLAAIQALQGELNVTRALRGTDARQACRTHNALCAAELVLHAMLGRKETRGPHYRVDFPQKSEDGLQALTWTPEGVHHSRIAPA